MSQNENLDLRWGAAPSLGHGDRAHRQQSKQTFRLGPTAPASLPPAVLLLPRVLHRQDDPSWLGGRTPGSAQKHSTKFSTQFQTLCHLPTSEASPPKNPLHQVLVQPQSRSPGEARGELAPLPPRRKCQITNSVIKIASVTSESLGGGGAVLLSRPPNARIFMILIFII